MLLDAREFAFSAKLEHWFTTLRADVARLADDEFLPWPVRAAYEGAGRWLVYPFFARECPPGMSDDFVRHRARCPASARALQSIPNIVTAAFSRLEPGCHILPHVDKYFPGVLRAHLGLIVPSGAHARIGAVRVTWVEGKVLLFDGQVEHEVENAASTPRTVLLADFVLTEHENDVLERARAAQRTRAAGAERRNDVGLTAQA